MTKDFESDRYQYASQRLPEWLRRGKLIDMSLWNEHVEPARKMPSPCFVEAAYPGESQTGVQVDVISTDLAIGINGLDSAWLKPWRSEDEQQND